MSGDLNYNSRNHFYLDLPERPLRAGRSDRERAIELHERGVALANVESALPLASMRRLGRSADSPPLSPIRSLAYFSVIVEELLEKPIAEGYLECLGSKARTVSGKGKTTKPGGPASGSEKHVSSRSATPELRLRKSLKKSRSVTI